MGINSAWQVPDPDYIFTPSIEGKYSTMVMPYLGFQAQIHNQFGNPYDFNLEGKLTFKGEKSEEFGYSVKVLYFEITANLDIQVYEQFRLAAGPYVGRRLRTSVTNSSNVNYRSIQDWDFGGVISASYSFKNLLFRVDYNHGMKAASYELSFVERTNRVLQFGLGYTIFSKKEKN